MKNLPSKPLYRFYNNKNELVLETEELITAQNFLKPGVEYKKELSTTPHKTIYCVYDGNNNLIMKTSKLQEVSDKFNRSNTYIEKRVNNGVFVNNGAVYSITKEMFYYNVCIMREPLLDRKSYRKQKEHSIIPEDKRETIENLPGEVWKMIDDGFHYNWCSNKGRFKIVDAEGNECLRNIHRSMGGRFHNKEYHDILLLSTVKGVPSIRCRTSRAIAKTFIDPTLPLNTTKGCLLKVDHKDNNTNNECVDNLRIITHSENLRAAYNEQGVTRNDIRGSRKCYAEKDGERREYNTTAELVRDITGKNNNGYFYAAVRTKKRKLYGWTIGYIEN